MSTPVARPPLIVWDLALSIAMWALSIGAIGIGAVMTIFGLAFFDYCPPAACSAQGALLSLMVAGAAAVIVVLVGFAWGLVRIVQRQLSWWVTVGALVLCLACWVVGFVGAATAADW